MRKMLCYQRNQFYYLAVWRCFLRWDIYSTAFWMLMLLSEVSCLFIIRLKKSISPACCHHQRCLLMFNIFIKRTWRSIYSTYFHIFFTEYRQIYTLVCWWLERVLTFLIKEYHTRKVFLTQSDKKLTENYEWSINILSLFC